MLYVTNDECCHEYRNFTISLNFASDIPTPECQRIDSFDVKQINVSDNSYGECIWVNRYPNLLDYHQPPAARATPNE